MKFSIHLSNTKTCPMYQWFFEPQIHCEQGPRSLRKCAGAKGGTIFSGEFLLHFCAIWKNDPFSKSENVPGIKPRLPRLLRGPCAISTFRYICTYIFTICTNLDFTIKGFAFRKTYFLFLMKQQLEECGVLYCDVMCIVQ